MANIRTLSTSPLDTIEAAQVFLEQKPENLSDCELYIKTAYAWRKELIFPHLEEATQKFCFDEKSSIDCAKLILTSRIGQSLSVQTRLNIYLYNANKNGFKEFLSTPADLNSRLLTLFESEAYKTIPVDLRTTFDNSEILLEMLKLQSHQELQPVKNFLAQPPEENKCDLYIKLVFRFQKIFQPSEAPFLKEAAKKASLEISKHIIESRIGTWLEPLDVINIYLHHVKNTEEMFLTYLRKATLYKELLLSSLIPKLEPHTRQEFIKLSSIQKILELERQRYGITSIVEHNEAESKKEIIRGAGPEFPVARAMSKKASRPSFPKLPPEKTFATEPIKLHEIEEKAITKCIALFPLPLNKKLLAVFEINSYHKMALIDPLTHQATMLSREFEYHIDLRYASLYRYYVLELADKRVLIGQKDRFGNMQINRVYDLVRNNLDGFTSMINVENVAVNNESILAILEQVYDHTRCHFFNINDLNTPFTTLRLSKFDYEIASIGDRFVTTKGMAIIKNKEGTFEESPNKLWANDSATRMFTVGEDKDRILRIETEGIAQFQQQNKLSLWQINDNKIEKCAEQVFYGNIKHVRPYCNKILITSFDPGTLRGRCCIWDLKLKETEHLAPNNCRFEGFNPVEIDGQIFGITASNQIVTVDWNTNTFQNYKNELETHCTFFPSPLVRMIAGYCIEESNSAYSGAGPGPQRL